MTRHDRNSNICTFQEKPIPTANISIRINPQRGVGTVKVKRVLFDPAAFSQTHPSLNKQILETLQMFNFTADTRVTDLISENLQHPVLTVAHVALGLTPTVLAEVTDLPLLIHMADLTSSCTNHCPLKLSVMKPLFRITFASMFRLEKEKPPALRHLRCS